MILLFLLVTIEARIDSLEHAFAQNRRIEIMLELSECYITTGQFHKSMTLLGQNERYFPKDADKSRIMYQLGNVFLFVGEVNKARDTYLQLMSRYPRLDIANDAAERLYIIETARDDTVQLKRLGNVIRLYETEQYAAAVDSARILLKSTVAPYAYLYMALAYRSLGDLTLTLGVLEEMNEKFPEHRVHEAILLAADVYMVLGKRKDAEEILKDLIVREPNTIYALKARQKLEKLEGAVGSNLYN